MDKIFVFIILAVVSICFCQGSTTSIDIGEIGSVAGGLVNIYAPVGTLHLTMVVPAAV